MSTDLIVTPAARRRAQGALERRCHGGLDVGHGVGRSQRKLLRPAGRITHRFPEREHVVGGVREKTEGVEALREWKHPLHREKPIARLESGDTAEGSRPQHRPAGLRAERDRHHPRRDGGGRPAGAAARRVRQIARVARRSRRPVRERRALRLAEQDRSALAHFTNDRGVGAPIRPL